MKTNKLLITLLACSIVGSAYAAPKAQWATTLSDSKSTLISQAIKTPQVNTNRQAVSFSYKLETEAQLDFNNKPFAGNSRQYWIDSTGNKLLQGIQLPVTGGDTIIRISPLSNKKSLQLTASMIKIQNNGVDADIQVFADSADLKATGAAFSDNSIALKVQSQPGSLNLKLDNFDGNTPFVVHVFEPKSAYVLSLATTQATFNANQEISINTQMLAAGKSINSNLQGYINRPDGSILGELTFNQNKNGSYSANLPAIGAQGLAQGLWEVHVFAKSNDKGIEIMRDVQTSFAVNLNSAEFTNNLKMTANTIEVGVNVGLEGRYEVRGVLMGINKAGEMQPLAITMTADWLSVGQKTIALELDAKLIAESGLSAPFSLKNVQLTNQTYLAPVQSIQAGIKLSGFNIGRELDLR